MTPPANDDSPEVQQHGQSSPQQTGGRHVVADHRIRPGTIPDALLQEIKMGPPQKKKHHHQRVESLSQTFEEEIEESFHNLESGDLGLKQT